MSRVGAGRVYVGRLLPIYLLTQFIFMIAIASSQTGQGKAN